MNIMSFLTNLFKSRKCESALAYYPDAVLVLSSTGEIIDANDNFLEMFDMNEEALSHTELIDIFEGGFNLVNDLIKSQSAAVVRSKLKVDEDLFYEIKASSFVDEEEKIVVAIRDVTKNQRLLNKMLFEHEYLNKLTKNKNTFLSKISGELTSPVHSINGFSQAILEGLGGEVNEKQEKYLKIINKNSFQLLDLIHSLVEYSKLESGLYDYEFKNFDFVNLMTVVFAELMPKAQDKKLVLNFDLNSLTKRTIYSDEPSIKKLIEILVMNAVAMTESGSIQVVVSHPDLELLQLAGFTVGPNTSDKQYLLVKINDTGLGYTESDLDTIFDPYANIDKYVAKKAVARSLSLGIAHNLARILKGRIWAESETLKGSSFCFILPIEKLGI